MTTTARRNGREPTLRALNYDGNPPRCGNCTKRFMKSDSGKVRTLMCALAQAPVRARGICDSWRGFDGSELDD